ncbi:MAG TPA: hypothetical protein VH351_06430 [Bryobacteraceae bacterium]|jgi:hypothetical protein|nr:hypothetical protein [Bryobacteraceae bacterium]
MRFFIPAASQSREAEEAYKKIRDHLANVIGPITEKRIYRLKYHDNGHPQNALVGSDHHGFGKGPVIAIFEGCDGMYYVCTQKNGMHEAELHPVHESAVVDAEDFSALA